MLQQPVRPAVEKHRKWLFHLQLSKSQHKNRQQPKEVQALLQEVAARGRIARPTEAEAATRTASTHLGLLGIALGLPTTPLNKRQSQHLASPANQAPKRRVELLPPNLTRRVEAREVPAEVMTLIIVARTIQGAGAAVMMMTASALRQRSVPGAKSRNLG